MKQEELQLASYKGAEWFATVANTSGARNIIKKKFVNSDRQSLQDLGLMDKVFTLNGTVSARLTNAGTEKTYLSVRKTLLDALEDGSGPGVLIHPTFGRLTDVVALNWSLNESEGSLGSSPISITFERDTSSGLPEVAQDVLGSVANTNEVVTAAVKKGLTDELKVTGSFAGNFQDAVDKTDNIFDAVNDATSILAITADKIDSFSKELSDFGANVVSLVANFSDLAASIDSLFLNMNGLYTTFTGTLAAFENLYPFGDNDTEIVATTVGLSERKKNRDLLNSAIQTLALSYAYLNAVQIDFRDTTQISETASRLEDQFQKIIESGLLGIDAKNALQDQRIAAQKFFNAQRDIRPRIVTVRTSPTSPRLLAYQNYGASTLGTTLSELNGLRQAYLIEGDVKVLTS